jgi:hypothetical protein
MGTDWVEKSTKRAGLSNRVDLRPLQTKLIQKRPVVIQELTCWPGGSSDYSLQADSVWQIFFSFYNGQLFRILVTYDQDATHRFLNSFALGMFSKRLNAQLKLRLPNL